MKAQENKSEKEARKESTQENTKNDIKSVEDLQEGKVSSRNGYGDRDPEDMQDGKKK